MKEALAFLEAVPAALLPGEYLEVRAVHQMTGTKRAWCKTITQTAATALAWSAAGAQVWVGINPRQGRQSGDAAVARSQALPADIDVKIWRGDTGAMRESVEAFPLRPSLVVSSGSGLQAYWLLDHVLPLHASGMVPRYRQCAYRLSRALCGQNTRPDDVSNPERLLRLPGTVNYKYSPGRPVELLWSEPRRYRLDDLQSWLAERAPWTAPAPVRPPVVPGPTSEVISDFNQRADVPALLERHGAVRVAQRGMVLHYRRPGKSEGISATFGHYPGILHVFSTEWPPFEAGHGYDAFEVLSLLEHEGDRRAAYHAAQIDGYGVRFGLRVDCGSPVAAARRLAVGSP